MEKRYWEGRRLERPIKTINSNLAMINICHKNMSMLQMFNIRNEHFCMTLYRGRWVRDCLVFISHRFLFGTIIDKLCWGENEGLFYFCCHPPKIHLLLRTFLSAPAVKDGRQFSSKNQTSNTAIWSGYMHMAKWFKKVGQIWFDRNQ